METFIDIPEGLVCPKPEETNRFYTKRWEALNWIQGNAFARATHFRLRANMKIRCAGRT